MEELDCRGLDCPEPLRRTMDMVEKGSPEDLAVLLDDEGAVHNVSAFLRGQGYELAASRTGRETRLAAHRVGPPRATAPAVAACRRPEETARGEGSLVFIGNDRVGAGDDELGRKLMLNFLATLREMVPDLWRLVLVNNGVKLAVTGAEALPALGRLEEAGVSILVCGTCLGHFNLMDSRAVGVTTNMLDIVTSLQVAGKVISLT